MPMCLRLQQKATQDFSLRRSCLPLHHRQLLNLMALSESQADVFAARLLSPACVLWGLNLRTAKEITDICKMSIAEAKKRTQRMKVLYKRQKFLTSPLERKLYEQFIDYIELNKTD